MHGILNFFLQSLLYLYLLAVEFLRVYEEKKKKTQAFRVKIDFIAAFVC